MRFWRAGVLLADTFLCQLLPTLASSFMGVWCTHTHRKVSPMTGRINLLEWLGHLRIILGYILWKRVCFECCCFFFSSKSKSDPLGDSSHWASKAKPATNRDLSLALGPPHVVQSLKPLDPVSTPTSTSLIPLNPAGRWQASPGSEGKVPPQAFQFLPALHKDIVSMV